MKTKLDIIFSKYIRTRDNGICITCGKQGNINEMQCGHFFSRNILSLRYNEKNCNCQCRKCNMFLGGNVKEYEKSLKLIYGDGIIDELKEIKNKHLKLSKTDYDNFIEVYKQKLKELNNEKRNLVYQK